ncbi:cysteine desulfurase NifS [Candidatus Shapirobacteria bacterium CG10_big_fil_rev_8_21_14_0_10_38_8]|nr:MAG: cysteine desulfurase NifS [Candidatus Shapirobacteria bacterium CG10_big_fil_rev_8_21_14_0_10_38_8]
MKTIYLDHAATTPVDNKVFLAMESYFSEDYGNPSEPHLWGQKARGAIDQAREKVAEFLGAKPQEIIFTSGATEAINLAHKGLIEAVRKTQNKTPHIITSSIEHKAVMETCKHLEKLGWAKVTYLPVNKDGLVNLQDLEKAIQPETILVSIMYINNEVGTIQPIREIGEAISQINKLRMENGELKIYFHTDATQAIQYLDCNVEKLGVDLLSLSGHKIYAPKGVGALYFKKGMPLRRQQDGGGQEYRLRAGTENVPYIVGLGKAIELAQQNKEYSTKYIGKLREKLIEGVLKIPKVELVGNASKNTPHIATFLVKGVEGESMMLLLSDQGIAASSGSACTSGLLEPSHVLLAMGYQPEKAHGSIRFSLGKDNTEEEIGKVIKVLPEIVQKLRKMAPKL